VAPASPPPTARRILPPPLPAQIPPPLPIQSDIEKRLKKLDDLREHNMISQTEYDAKRQEILSKI
jgi:restriction endonuclease S subunit